MYRWSILARVYVTEKTHRRVKQFAARKGITIQEAYEILICSLLDEYGIEKRGVILTK